MSIFYQGKILKTIFAKNLGFFSIRKDPNGGRKNPIWVRKPEYGNPEWIPEFILHM